VQAVAETNADDLSRGLLGALSDLGGLDMARGDIRVAADHRGHRLRRDLLVILLHAR